MDLAPVVRQALALWHSPSFNELPMEDVAAAANRCFMRHSLDLELTADAIFYQAETAVINFPNADARKVVLKNEAVPIVNVSRIIRVESRPAASSDADDWRAETFISYANWEEGRGDLAFYSTTNGLVMIADRDRTASDFRIIYHAIRDRIVTTNAATVDLPSVYEPVFVYDLALEMGEMIDNRSPEWRQIKADKMKFLIGRLDDELTRIEKWRRSQHNRGPIHRKAFNNRDLTFDFRKRKLTVWY